MGEQGTDTRETGEGTDAGKGRPHRFDRESAAQAGRVSARKRAERKADADANPLGVSRADLVAIARKLAQAAKAGDTGAARLVLQYVAILNPAATKEEGTGDSALDVDAMTAEQRIELRERIARELAS